MEEEIVAIKQEYSVYFLYDLLEMVRGALCIINTDKKLNSLFMQLFDYVGSQMDLPFDGEILDMDMVLTVKK